MTGPIQAWEIGPPDRAQVIIALRGYYEFMAQRLFSEYEITKSAPIRVQRNFIRRLDEWLNGFSSEQHQLAAFKSVQYLLFAGRNEHEELYRCAYQMNIVRWLADVTQTSFFDSNAETRIQRALARTWIAPATDSLRINEFLKIAGIKGHSLRTDWRGLSRLGDAERIRAYVDAERIERLVVIEDFVGSGKQFWSALSYAAALFDGPILALPLIICEVGRTNIERRIRELGRNNIALSPVLNAPLNCLVGREAQAGEPRGFTALRRAMRDGYRQMAITLNGEEYGWESIGSLTVLHSNCPNNVPPIFHCDAGGRWNPLFPRASRA